MRLRSIALVTLTLTAACGSDDRPAEPTGPDAGPEADGSPATPVPLTTADLCGADGAYATFVSRSLACAPELVALLGIELDGAELGAACDAQLAPYVEDGTIELGTRADLEECLAALDALDCTTDDIRTLRDCDPVISGAIDEGGACEVDGQCAGDAYCDTESGGFCGVCKPREADGASCTEDDQCAGRRCTGATAGAPGSCRAVGLDQDRCDVDDDCAGTLRCDPSDKRCEVAPAWAAGDPCVANTSDCGFPTTGLFCEQSSEQCAAFAGVGEACAGGAATCDFGAYEICDDSGSGLCVAPRTSALGQPCGFFAGQKCQSGLICSQPITGGTCVDPSVGSSCDPEAADFACGFLLECRSDGTCQYPTRYTGSCP